jgi:two-component system CheB/CheR fusion protein
VLDELLKECVEEIQNDLPKHKIIIEGYRNIEVHADRNRLEQVIINLISNAIKYSPDANKVIVSIEKEKEGIKVSVEDFGIGIPKDKLPLIFDRFYRVDEDSQRYAGLGLGLYISAEIIRQHGGHIDIESAVSKGSTFWFTIPE